jgi:microcystin-dependent protein
MTGKLALRDALNKHGQRMVEKHKGSHWASVIDTTPLTLDIHDYDHNVFEGDDFSLSQSLTSYRQSVGLHVDDLVLLQDVGDAWVAVDVVSDKPVPALGGGKVGPTGPIGPQGPIGNTGPIGAQGPIGNTGAQGPIGNTGPQGAQGPQGVQGVQGAVGPAGQSFTYRGAWASGTAYVLDDVVTGSDGSSYIAMQANTGHDPTTDSAHTYWSPMAIHGATGPQGAQGAQGVAGPTGPKGDQGLIGTTGNTGPTGPAGGLLYTQTIGDGSSTQFVVTHGLGTVSVQVTVYQTAAPHAEVTAEIAHTDANTITVTTTAVPASGEFTVAVNSPGGPGPQGPVGPRGSQFNTYTGSGTPPTGTFPGERDGDQAVRASDGEMFQRVNGVWVDQGWRSVGATYDSDQIGTVKTYSGATIPTNWMLADGRALQRASYPDLFTALGGTSSPWGLPDSATFNIPDLRSRMLVAAGQGAGLTARAMAAASGSESVTLDATMIPGHSHQFNVNSGYISSDHSHSLNINSGGASARHNHYTVGNQQAVPSAGSWPLAGGGASISAGAYPYMYPGANFTPNQVGTSNDLQDHGHNVSGGTSGVSANHYHNVAGGTDNGSGGGLSHSNMPPWCAIAMIVKVTGAQINPGGALQGATGQRGAIWYIWNGAGIPPAGTFVGELDGDWAIRQSDGENFERVGGVWVDQNFTNRTNATPVAARGYGVGTLTLTSGAFTKIPLDTIDHDTGGNMSTATGRFTCPSPGWYQASGSVETPVAAGARAIAAIFKNGTEVSRGSGGTADTNVTVSAALYCAAGDYLELWAYNSGAVTGNIPGGGQFRYLSVALITAGSGPQGARGAIWFTYNGTGTPATGTFSNEADNDMAMRSSDGEVFKRVSGAWVDQGWKATAGITQTPTAVRMRRAAAFSLTANTWMRLPLDTADFDTAGMASVANGRVNILTDGVYQVDANVLLNASATGTYTTVACGIYKNGAQYSQNYSQPAIQILGSATASDKIQCKAGDYLELYALNSQGLTTWSGVSANYLSVALIAAGPGPQGQRGSNWFTYTGAGTPAAGTFTGELDGDMAVRASDGEVFRRIAGAWADQNWKQSTGMATMDKWHQVGQPGEPAFLNAWVNYGGTYAPAQFRKYPDGTVRIRGLVQAGASSTAVFTLPPGYRPQTGQQIINATDINAEVHSRLEIYPDGTVILIWVAPGGSGYASINCNFDTDTVTNYAVGTRGANWFAYSGAGVPPTPSFTGEIDNDMAVRTSDSEVFKRIAGVWTDQSYKAGVNITSTAQVTARMHVGAAQTTNGWTKVALDTIDFDASATVADLPNHRMIAPTTGYYRITGLVTWGGSTWTGTCIASVYVNGVETRGMEQYATGNGSDLRSFLVDDVFRLKQGDVVELWAYSAVGFSLNVGPVAGCFLSMTLDTAGPGPQGPPGPGPGGSVQRNIGKYAGYNTMSGSANILDGAGGGGAGNALILTVTPTVPSWWEVNFYCANILAVSAAYYYTQLTMGLSPADLDGISATDGWVITQHSQVQTYEGRAFLRIFRLAANQTYTITPALATSGGSFQYYTAPSHLWIEGKLWPQ